MVVCARVRSTGRNGLFQTDEESIRRDDTVIADVDTGLDTAVVLCVKKEEETPVDQADQEEALPHIHRKATQEDLQQLNENARFEEEGRLFCAERVRSRDLPMKIVSTSVTFDRKKFVFYFTAEKRVDFRELVKDLASRFRTRIELRQIGIRDEAKLVGGIGCCGREVCCRLFLTQFAPISIKMAKGQDIALNPNKISGLCGRLMCCLGYEKDSSEPRRRDRREPNRSGAGSGAGSGEGMESQSDQVANGESGDDHAQESVERKAPPRPARDSGERRARRPDQRPDQRPSGQRTEQGADRQPDRQSDRQSERRGGPSERRPDRPAEQRSQRPDRGPSKDRSPRDQKDRPPKPAVADSSATPAVTPSQPRDASTAPTEGGQPHHRRRRRRKSKSAGGGETSGG